MQQAARTRRKNVRLTLLLDPASGYDQAMRPFLPTLLLALSALACIRAQASQCPAEQFAGGQMPRITVPALARDTRPLCSHFFSVLYSGVSRTPLYSAEHLTADSVARAMKEPARLWHRESAFRRRHGLTFSATCCRSWLPVTGGFRLRLCENSSRSTPLRKSTSQVGSGCVFSDVPRGQGPLKTRRNGVFTQPRLVAVAEFLSTNDRFNQ